MLKLIIWLIGLVGIFFGIYVLMDNPGDISIKWFGYVIETSIAFCLSIVAIFSFIIYLVHIPRRWIRLIKKTFKDKQTTKNKTLLLQILTNILCEDLTKNEVLIKKLQKTAPKDNDLILLLKALSKTDKLIYKQLIKNTTTEKAGWLALIDESIEKGEITLATENIENLLSKMPKQEWVLKKALSLYTLQKDWNNALNCLDKLYKLNSIDAKKYNKEKAFLLVKQDKGTEAFKLCPSLSEAAILAAKESPKKAEKIYRCAWQENPSFEIYKAYVKLFAKENTLSQYKHVLNLCEANKDAQINALVIADAAINAQLWSEAKKELNAYIENYPLTTNVAVQMAIIEMEANHNVKEAQKWLEKALELNNFSALCLNEKCKNEADITVHTSCCQLTGQDAS